MSIHHVKGSILKDETMQYIGIPVNCIAYPHNSLLERVKCDYPKAYESYLAWRDESGCPHNRSCLDIGNIKVVPVDSYNIVLMATQYYYGKFAEGDRAISYDGIWDCLNKIAQTAPIGSKIGLPGYLGCGEDGGNWHVIYIMICDVLEQDYEVYIFYED